MADFDPDEYLSQVEPAEPSDDSAPPQQAQGDFDPDAYLAGLPADDNPQAPPPAPEGMVKTAARRAVGRAGGVMGGLVGMGMGAAEGAGAGLPGIVVGGLIGMGIGAYGGQGIEDEAKEGLGLDDSTQQAINAEANPWTSNLTDAALNIAGMGPAAGAGVAVRAGSAALGGVLEAGEEAASGEDFSPTKIALQAATNAVFPGVNKLGQKFVGAGERASARLGTVPGRPNQAPNPAAAQAHADVGDTSTQTAVGDSSTAEEPPVRTAETIGTPLSRPTNSQGEEATGKGGDSSYIKTSPSQVDGDTDMLTTGDMPPDWAAALAPDQVEVPGMPRPEPQQTSAPEQPQTSAPEPTPQAEPHAQSAPQPAPEPKPAEAAAPAQPAFDPDQYLAQLKQPVDAGFPRVGEPLDPGAGGDGSPRVSPNGRRPTLTLKSNAQEGAAPVRNAAPRVDEPVSTKTGKAEPNPSDAQVEAGNYQKAHERVLGRDVSYETEKGGTRRSKPGEPPWETNDFPADYGHVLGVKGADGDNLDLFNLRNGDKHYVIDQRNPETGKFDEHKIMANARDLNDARDAYTKSFSDGSGVSRIHDITPATEGDLKAWMALGNKKKPYSKVPFPQAVKQPKVVTAAVEKLKAAGQHEIAAKIMELPEAARVIAANKAARALINKTGELKTGEIKNIRVRQPAESVPGTDVQSKGPRDAARKSGELNALREVFDRHTPVKDEADADTIARAKALAEEAKTTGRYPFDMRKKQEPAMLVRAARTLAKDKDVSAFRATEQLLRSDDPAAHETVRQQQAEASIGRSHRAGDEATDRGEAAIAERNAGVNTEEDEMHDRIESKRNIEKASDIDDDLKKTLDMDKPADRKELAALFNKKAEQQVPEWKKVRDAKQKEIADRTAELLAARKAKAGESVDTPVRKIKLKDGTEVTPEEFAKIGEDKPPVTPKERYQDAAAKFLGDESASMNPKQIYADAKKFLKNTDKWLEDHLRTPHQRTGPETWMPRRLVDPKDKYYNELSDTLYGRHTEQKDHEIQLLKHLEQIYKDQGGQKTILQKLRAAFDGRNPKVKAMNDQQERIYLAREANKIHTLSPEDLKAYQDQLEGGFQQNDAVKAWIDALDPNKLGPSVRNHVYRLARGPYDPLNPSGKRSIFSDPIGGVNKRRLAGKAPGTGMDRTFVAFEHPNGARLVIAPEEGKGYTLWDKGTPIKVADPTFKFEDGKQVDLGGHKWTMTDALTPEIETNAKGSDGKFMKYYKNAAVSMAMANAQLTETMRGMQMLRDITEDPRFKAESTTNPKDQRVLDGEFVRNLLPETEHIFTSKRIAHILDDYAAPGFSEETFEKGRNIGRALLQTLFWNPMIHPQNIGAHFYAGRGWDNFTPKGLHMLVKHTGMAIADTIHPGPLTRELLNHNAALMYTNVATEDMTEKVLGKFGEYMDQNKPAWDQIAKRMGVEAKDIGKAVVKASRHITWASNDVFYKSLYLDNRAKGMDPQHAVNATEKDIPNYRVQHELFGSRALSKFQQDTLASGFGRYHTGMMNAFGNIADGLVHGDKTEKLEAMGKIVALGVLGMIIKPYLDEKAKYITGNRHAEMMPRGPLTPINELGKALTGKADIMAPVRSVVSLSPFLAAMDEFYKNKDFGGRNIVEPGDVALAAKGSMPAAARAATQAGMNAARSAFQPLNQSVNAIRNPHGGLGVGLRDQLLGIRNPTPKAGKWEDGAEKKAIQTAASRARGGGHDFVENWLTKTFGFR